MGRALPGLIWALVALGLVAACREPALEEVEVVTRGVQPSCAPDAGPRLAVDTYVAELYRGPPDGVIGASCELCDDCERVSVACRCGPPREPETRELRRALAGLELGPFSDEPPGRYCVRLRGLRVGRGGAGAADCACAPEWVDPPAAAEVFCARSRASALVEGGSLVLDELACVPTDAHSECLQPIGAAP